MANNSPCIRIPIGSSIEIERMNAMYRYVESIKSAAPKATLAQDGRYCRKKPNLAAINKKTCAIKDRIKAAIKCSLRGNNEDMIPWRYKERVSRAILLHDLLTLSELHYNLASIYLI